MAKLKDTSKQTDLSIKIREYISKSGIPVYKIAQTSGLGRAAIQHIMSGYMFPSKEFLDKLIHALYLTPKEKIELYDLYQQEKIGKGEYYNRHLLKALIEGIDDGSRRSGIVFDKIRLPQTDILPYSVISGEKEVYITILQCVAASLSNKSHHAPYLFTNIPRISDELCYAMKEFLIEKAGPKTAVVHFTKLVKHDPKQKNDNIIALKNILQIASYMNTYYKPYAYYSTNDQGEELITAFPYFFVTDEYVIQISTDMTRAFIISDTGYVREYHDHCSKLMSLSVEMLNTFTPKEKFDAFFNLTPILYQTIEFQPSLTQYFTFDIIDKYLPDTPEKELFLARCIDLLKMSDDLDKKCQAKCVYFSENGLKHFADTGIITNIPGKLLTPISSEDRIYLLSQLKNEIGTHLKMIKPSSLNVPTGFSMLAFRDDSILITYFTDNIDYVCSLKESSLCLSIGSFIESFDEDDKCCSTAYTLNVIDEQIAKLQKLS